MSFPFRSAADRLLLGSASPRTAGRDTVAGLTGLEPVASDVTGLRYDHLNYSPGNLDGRLRKD